MTFNAGITGVSTSFPTQVRTSEDLRRLYPHVVAASEARGMAKVWTDRDSSELTKDFDAAMRPFLSDPFRGTVERRILASGQTARDLEVQAAHDLLQASGKSARDIELLLVGSFLPDQLGVGNSAYIAEELGLEGAAWNIESACCTTIVGIQTACALVRSGEYRNAMIVISCSYSRFNEDEDTIGWFLGDGAGAILIERVPEGQGLLGAHIVHSGDTCGAARYEAVASGGGVDIRLRTGPKAGRQLREASTRNLRTCVDGALAKANIDIGDISFFAFNEPTAWYVDFCVRLLGIPANKTVNVYPFLANIGPALTVASMHLGASKGLVKTGDLALIYGIGSVSSVGALVVRWGETSLGPRRFAD